MFFGELSNVSAYGANLISRYVFNAVFHRCANSYRVPLVFTKKHLFEPLPFRGNDDRIRPCATLPSCGLSAPCSPLFLGNSG